VNEKDFLVDLSQVDFNHIVASAEEIRRYNPQRFEMEQLSAVVYVNEKDYSCVGYKDVTDREFWVRGHMPDLPLMPGVVMLESIAQLCSFVTQRYDPIQRSLPIATAGGWSACGSAILTGRSPTMMLR